MALRRGKMLKKRTEWMAVLFVIMFCAIGVRAFYLQVLQRQPYLGRAEHTRQRNRPLLASRGMILDRTGRELVVNLPGCAVYAEPKKMKDRQMVAAKLAEITKMDQAAIYAEFAIAKGNVCIGRQMPADVGEGIQKANLEAVGVSSEPRRFYACGTLAANLIGFTKLEGAGQEGIEKDADKYLKGTNGYAKGEIDSRGRFIPETMREVEPKVDGKNVVLTIDAYLQHIVEQALKKSFDRYHAAGASAIVMDPNTGEVLALASFPTFDPNDRKGVKPEQFQNRPVRTTYEPGSTLKMITVCAALQEGMSPTAKMAVCTSGGMPLGNRRIHCSLHHPYGAGHGAVDMFAIIRHSCNIGAATLAMRLGSEKLYSYEKAFGLTDRPDCEIRRAAYFPLPRPDSWSTMMLANIGFGQGVSVSPLQMAGAYSAIANGGNLMKPRIIRELRDRDGNVVVPFKPVVIRRVISESTARLATQMAVGCVDEGTGKPAQVTGYSVAGKTGSAQKARPGGLGYYPDKFVASFMGFLPASNPRLVICVVVDEPKGTHYGAVAAAPVFQEIARQAMWYLKVAPDVPIEKEAPGSTVSVKKVRDKLGAGHTG